MNHSFQAADDLQVMMARDGNGRPAMVLHGGGGPITVAAISAHLSLDMQVFTPTHPGWNGTRRPDGFGRVADIADAYLRFLKEQGLRDVLLVGSSMGGWIAAEMASRDKGGLVGAIVLINAVGIEVPCQPIASFFGLTPRQIVELAFFDPDRFFIDPTTLPPERVEMQRANIAALQVYAGNPYMHDPSLIARLAEVKIPTLLIWGDADKVVTPEYGRAYSKAFPNAAFTLIPRAGHLPHIEQPEATFAAIDGFRLQV